MDEGELVNTNSGIRLSLPSAAIMIVFFLEWVGAWLSVLVWGTDIWLPIGMLVIGVGCALRQMPAAAIMVLANMIVGAYISIYLWGFWIWPSVLLVQIGIVMIATHLYSNSGTDATGDQNPIIYIAMIIAMRGFAALVYLTVDPIEELPTDFLDWLTLFLLGTLPDLPLIANILLATITTGTLTVYLALLVKRILNPVAN